jgi:Flp pilus assembly protein TadD
MALLEYGLAADILYALAERLPQNAEVRYHVGCLAHERNELPAARAALAEACRLAPGWLEAHSELGAILYRMRLFDQAIEHYRIAESLAPENPIIKANIGFCYVEVGETEAARQYFAAYDHHPSQDAAIDLAVRCAQDLL